MLDVRVSAFAEAVQQAKRMDDKATHALDQVRGARTAITAGTKGMWSFTATKALCDTQLEMEDVKETARMLATMYESVNDTLVNGLVPSYRAVLEPLGIEPPADRVFFDPSYDVEARMSECDDAGRALSAAAASISDALVGLDGADGIKSCLTNCLNPPDRYFEPIYISKTKNPYRTTKERDRDIRDQMEEFKNIVERFRHGRLPIPPQQRRQGTARTTQAVPRFTTSMLRTIASNPVTPVYQRSQDWRPHCRPCDWFGKRGRNNTPR